MNPKTKLMIAAFSAMFTIGILAISLGQPRYCQMSKANTCSHHTEVPAH